MTRGGKRTGSGRKSLPYKSKTIRIPIDLLKEVKEMITKYKKEIK